MNINRAENGFIKIHKSIMDSDLAEDEKAFVAFVRMIRYAHFEDDFTSVRFNGRQTYLKRGEFSATVSELAGLFNMPLGTIRKVLSRLERDQRISKRTDRQKTIFSICNFSKYQDAPANERANERANVTEGKKNIKNIKNNIYVELDYQLRRIHVLACELFGKDPESYKLSEARKKQLRVRLKDIGEERMENALRAIAASPFHRGENDRGWEADPYWVFSSFEKAEKWSEMEKKSPKNLDLSKMEIEV